MSNSTVKLAGVVATYVAAVNAFDEDAVVATFADDALVNDVRREFWGHDAIRGSGQDQLVYFTVRDGKIVPLIIIHNAPYPNPARTAATTTR